MVPCGRLWIHSGIVGGGLWPSGSQVVMVGTIPSPCGASPCLSPSRLLTHVPQVVVLTSEGFMGSCFSCCKFEPYGVPWKSYLLMCKCSVIRWSLL